MVLFMSLLPKQKSSLHIVCAGYFFERNLFVLMTFFVCFFYFLHNVHEALNIWLEATRIF